MKDHKDLISRYFADISKIVIAAAVIQPLASNNFSVGQILIGILTGMLLILSAIFIK